MWSYQGKKVATGKDFDPQTGGLTDSKKSKILLVDEALAKRIKEEVAGGTSWIVDNIDEKSLTRKPAPPFITSTLQQEANRKLGLE